jgi:hypothetical protein
MVVVTLGTGVMGEVIMGTGVMGVVIMDVLTHISIHMVGIPTGMDGDGGIPGDISDLRPIVLNLHLLLILPLLPLHLLLILPLLHLLLFPRP